MFNQIKIILMNTTHPGNIGAVARAMKNMGFKDLCLVSPKIFPSDEANARAAGAEDVLATALVVNTLDEALADCHWAFGLSARARKIPLPMLTVREAAETISHKLEGGVPGTKIALVFGQEQSGLLNEELGKCHYQVTIPANAEYASLNIAQAAQIVTYELRMAILSIKESNVLKNDDIIKEKNKTKLATISEVECFYQQLEKNLIQIGFLDPASPGYLMQHLRRLYAKSALTNIELNILHGILTATQKSV